MNKRHFVCQINNLKLSKSNYCNNNRLHRYWWPPYMSRETQITSGERLYSTFFLCAITNIDWNVFEINLNHSRFPWRYRKNTFLSLIASAQVTIYSSDDDRRYSTVALKEKMQKIVLFIEAPRLPFDLPFNIGDLFMNRCAIDEEANFEILKIFKLEYSHFDHHFGNLDSPKFRKRAGINIDKGLGLML